MTTLEENDDLALTFRILFFRMLSTANTCSPIAESSMPGYGLSPCAQGCPVLL